MFCTDIPAPFLLIFSDSIPYLLYYSHIPTAIVALIIGFFVLFKNRLLESKILFSISFVFVVWVFLNLVVWVNIDSRLIMFTWSFFGILYVLIYLLSLYFVYVFIERRDVPFWGKLSGFLLMSAVIVFSLTRYNLESFNLTYCEASEGVIYTNLYYLFGFFIFLWILVYGIYKYFKEKTEFRSQILFLIIGIESFLFSFFLSGFLASYLVEQKIITDFGLEQYGLFGMTIFIGFLAYLIVKFRAFNIKVFAAQALIVALVILIASEYFFVESSTSIILVGVTLIMALGFGYVLIKSVKRDIEQLEILSGELVEANIQLKKLDKAKSEFISIASHQLRTPLTAIKGYTSLIIEGSYGKIEKTVKEALQKTYSANERLILLVEDLLNVSRIESGRMKYELADVRLEDLTRQSYDSLILNAKDLGLNLKINPPKNPLPFFHIDGGKVREVISNFIDNAVKYTEKGGVDVSFQQDTEAVRIVISDTGIGIPKEELPYLFKKFSRGKDTSRLNATGTGLGLFVGKNIIEAHGGKVWVESKGVGKGSQFYIQLPLKWVDPNANAEVGMKEGE